MDDKHLGSALDDSSLDEAQRNAEFALTLEQAEELDRRLAEHLADPGSAIPWDEVRRKMGGQR